MNARIIDYRPPRIAMALLASAAVLHFANSNDFFVIFRNVPIGLFLMVPGFALMMGAWWQFQINNVAVCPTQATERLIISGTYRFSRNPMYLGIVLMLSGIALIAGSLPFYASAVLFAVIIDRHFCRYEEVKLKSTFGSEYERYAARVRRWL